MKHSGDMPDPENNREMVFEPQHRVEDRAQGKTEEGADKSVMDSGQTYDMQKIREAVENSPDIREGKVAPLKKMITSGEYQVNAREVADKMIKEFLLDEALKR
jgi:negative regulator of flagellin synthesis FlgM